MSSSASSQAPRTSRERIVDAAARLFHTQGFAATGMAEILAAAGTGSSSLYHHFKGKEDLLLAVLDHLDSIRAERIFGPHIAAIADPIERVFAVLDFYRAFLGASDCALGCPIGNLLCELADSHPQARARLDRSLIAWRQDLERLLADAGLERPGLDPEQLSTFVLAVMEGAVLQARATRSLEPFDACVRTLRVLLDPRPPAP